MANARYSEYIGEKETKSKAGMRYRRPHFVTGSPLPGLVTGKSLGGLSNTERPSKNPRHDRQGANPRRGGPPNNPIDPTIKPHRPSKGERRYGGVKQQIHDNRLWDPRKGTQVTQVNHATAQTTTSPVSDESKSPRLSPTQCLDRSKKTKYLVTDPCDPDSFDRGGAIQVSYETNHQTKAPKHNGNSLVTHQKKGKRNRDRKENRGQFQQQSHDTPFYSTEESETLLPRGPSLALMTFLSNKDDKILGRLAFGFESGVYSSTRQGNKDGDVLELDSLDAMMARLTIRTLFHVSGPIVTGSEAGVDMILAGSGSQFEKIDYGMD